MLPIYTSSSPLDFEAVTKLEPFSIDKDILERDALYDLSAILAIDPQNLYFVASFNDKEQNYQANYNQSLELGEFAPNLWKQDLAEFFLCDDHSEAYQEFNLAPSGAWWSQLFSTYRIADAANFSKPKQVRCKSQLSSNSWQVALEVPRTQLSVDISFEHDSKANVNFIVGQEPRIYYSWAKIKSSEADFHIIRDFERVELIALD